MPVGLREREHFSKVVEMPWDLFLRDFIWTAGQHVTIIGPNGQGKTTLALHLESKRPYVVIFGSKPRDPLFDELIKRGWVRVKRWPRATQDDEHGRRRILLWIPTGKRALVKATSETFLEALEKIMDEGAWVVDIDELMFAANPKWLALGDQFELMWQQARTLGVSLLVKAQRSSNIPLLAYDQVEHLFVFRENDYRNADRIGEMAGLDRMEVRDVVRELERFEVLYIGVRTGTLIRTKAPKIL
jgi:hypothetical protein